MDRLVGRDDLIAVIEGLLDSGHNVLLHGPAYVGKSALVGAISRTRMEHVIALDPFEHVTPHFAAEIRRAMDLCGQQYVAATRSLDRRHLGAVRRIAWRFTTVRIPPLSNRVTQRIIAAALSDASVDEGVAARAWRRAAADLAAGRPGVARAIVGAAVKIHQLKGLWPSTAAAFVEARIAQSGFGELRAR
jgi:hypothetical protein